MFVAAEKKKQKLKENDENQEKPILMEDIGNLRLQIFEEFRNIKSSSLTEFRNFKTSIYNHVLNIALVNKFTGIGRVKYRRGL